MTVKECGIAELVLILCGFVTKSDYSYLNKIIDW